MSPLSEKCQQCGRLVFADEMVTISATEYLALLSRPSVETPEMGKPTQSVIARDRELGDYIIECATPGTMILRDIEAACVARFGPDRVPSKSAIHRFIQAASKGRRPTAILSRD